MSRRSASITKESALWTSLDGETYGMASPMPIYQVRFSVSARCGFQNFCLKLLEPGKALRLRSVLYGDVNFGERGIVYGLLPQKHAQLHAADFFSLAPTFPGFRVRSKDRRSFLLRAHAACE